MRKRTLLIAFVMCAIGLPGALESQESIGSFYFSAQTDPFDDTDRSAIINVGEDIEAGTTSLAWKCMSDGLNVLILLGGYMGGDSDNQVHVRYRFDSTPASDVEGWQLLSNSESAYIPMEQVNDFTGRALVAEDVLIRVIDPLDGEMRTNNFPLSGLSEALRRLSCSGEFGGR